MDAVFGRRRTKGARLEGEVRLAAPEDRQGFLALAEALYRELGEDRPPRGRLVQLFDDTVAPASPFKLLFAVVGDELCGMLSLAIVATTQGAGCFAYVDDVFVLEQYRRQGLGAKLMREALEYARKSGCVRVELSARRDNVAARRLYERLGFREVDGIRYLLMLS
ncbi:MAG: GNAT family N-acetyltransferase [Dehalococcoidia bacterium]